MDTLRQADGLPLLDRLHALARSPLQQVLAAGDRAWYSAVLGDFDTAIAQGSAALAMAEPLGNEALLTLLRQRLGTTLSLTGRFEEALPHMRAAEQGIGLLAAPEVAAEFHGNLAVVLSNLGRPLEAQPHYERSVSISRDIGAHSQLATNLANYASSCLDAGDLALASAQIAQAQRIVSTYELDGSSAGYIATLQAQCERGAGRYATALEWCRRAEDIISERNPSRVPVARLPLAQVWLELGQHARAQQVLGGEALAAARRMPARYAVRWLVLLARLQRRLRQDVTPLLAEAATLAPADGWPELRLIVRTELALGEAPAEAVARLLAVADEAQAFSLHGAELGALLHAAQRAPDAALALALAQRATARASATEALHTDRALRYTAPARAWVRAGRAVEAQALWDEGQAWLRTTAAAHVPAEFADSFLHQHPLHRQLLGPLPGAAD